MEQIVVRARSVAPTGVLVGRDAERAALVAALSEGGQRLITLVGQGGIGKTSLALHVAADLAGGASFPDGVAVALLAAVASADDVPLAVAEALGISQSGSQLTVAWLVEALRERALLLVLDNLEHLLAAHQPTRLMPLLARIVAEAPGVRVLATSRERLRLRGEHVFDLGGLAFPANDNGLRIERLAAVQLFVEHAQRMSATFTLAADNRRAVAHICRRLEGLPLAIELAAAWVRALTPQEIAAEIDRSLDFLAGDAWDTPERHRSVRAALEHSWRYLDRAERHTLMRLSVFRGGGERAAATHVADTTLAVLTGLIDKSLVRVASVGGVSYYLLHELVRQYAAEQLAADPEDERATAARHASYYADLLQRSVEAQTGGAAPEVWATLTRHIDNLRAAWLWAATHGDSTTVMRMALGMMLLYDTCGWLLDGATLFGRAADALDATAPETQAVRGVVISWQGYFLYRVARLQEAARLLEQALALTEAAGNTQSLPSLLMHLGSVYLFSGRFAQARAYHARAMEVAAAVGDDFTRHWLGLFQGMVALFTGDYRAAREHLSATLSIWRAQHFSRGIGSSLLLLGETVRLGGQPAEAERAIRESLQISSASRDLSTIAACLRELGALALERGELDEARYLLTESYNGMRALGDAMFAGRSRSLLIRLDVQQGELASARQGCAELVRSASNGLALLLTEAAYGMALLLVAEGAEDDALAVLHALDGAPGEFATLALAAKLHADLVQRRSASASSERGAAQALLPLLETLCARTPAALPLAPSSPASDAPIVPTGALFVAETGAILSPREVEVLRLLIAGVSNQALADTLVISLHTAKKHVASVLEKLQVATRTQAALRGRALGLTPFSTK